MVRIFMLGLGILWITAVGLSCGGPNEEPARVLPEPELSELVQRSAQLLVEGGSFHFELQDVDGRTIVAPGLYLVRASGDVAIPRAIRVVMTVGVDNVSSVLEMELRVVDSDGFVADPISGRWRRVDAAGLPVNFVALEQTIRTIVTQVGGLRDGGLESGSGQPQRRISGNVSPAVFGSLFSGALTPSTTPIEIEMSIGVDDALLSHVEIKGAILASDLASARRTLLLSKYGLTVDVGAPPGV